MIKEEMRGERGFTIIEAIIAIAVLGIVGTAILTGLSTSFKANITADRQTVALSLAQSQLEDIERQRYITATSSTNWQVQYQRLPDSAIPGGYTIWSYDSGGGVHQSTYSPLGTNPQTGPIGVSWNGTTGQPEPLADSGLQRVKLLIRQGGTDVLTLETYKAK